MLDFLKPTGEPRYIPANIDYIWMDVVKKVELLKAKINEQAEGCVEADMFRLNLFLWLIKVLYSKNT